MRTGSRDLGGDVADNEEVFLLVFDEFAVVIRAWLEVLHLLELLPLDSVPYGLAASLLLAALVSALIWKRAAILERQFL